MSRSSYDYPDLSPRPGYRVGAVCSKATFASKSIYRGLEVCGVAEIRLILEPPIGRVLIDRPAQRNAMSADMWRALELVCAALDANTDIGAVIIEGSGGNFCSGADISEFEKTFADLASARSYLKCIERALVALSSLSHPTIAKVEGAAIGGGFAIALACDMRIASEDAQMAIPPAKLGLIYGPVETLLLVEMVGPAIAKDLLFSARTLASDEALKLGLINRIAPACELAEAVEAQGRLWSQLSHGSIRGAKKAIRAAMDRDTSSLRALAEEAAMSEDFREGRLAFQAKRRPNFKRKAQR